jgi:hypothetical protein
MRGLIEPSCGAALLTFSKLVGTKMMSRLWSFLLGGVAGAALLHAAMNYHLIRAADGFHLIAKSPARLSETFVDIRSFSMKDWTGRPQLASAMVRGNQQHLLGDAATDALRQGVNELLPDWPKQ